MDQELWLPSISKKRVEAELKTMSLSPIKQEVLVTIKFAKAISKNNLMKKLNYAYSPQIMKAVLDSLMRGGEIKRDTKFRYRDASTYSYKAKAPKVVPPIPKEVEAMYEQIITTLSNLIADVRGAVEETRKLKIENQYLIERLIKINNLLNRQEDGQLGR